jgi:hypothetical protein
MELVAVGSGSNVSCAGAGQGPEQFGAAFSSFLQEKTPHRHEVVYKKNYL